jgi:endonuclease-3
MRKQEGKQERVKRAHRVASVLKRLYPDARISLDFGTPWECLVATILSAQCTDERVNRVTPALFKAIPDVYAMAAAPSEQIEKLIASTGFFRSKARALKGSANVIVERFGGKVPARMEELTQLPGVGRKTANVIIGHVFGQPAITVDTHVRRVAFRLGLTRNRDPEKIEQDLRGLIPASEWTAFSMRLILHGRRICQARNPRCDDCELSPDCPRIGVAIRLKATRATSGGG